MADQEQPSLPGVLWTECRKEITIQAWQEAGCIGIEYIDNRTGKVSEAIFLTPTEESELLNWLLQRLAARLS